MIFEGQDVLFSREAERCSFMLQNSYKNISSTSWLDPSQLRSACLQAEVKVQEAST